MIGISRRTFIAQGCLTLTSLVLPGCYSSKQQLITVVHFPKVFSRRSGQLTANICGLLADSVKKATYTINDGNRTPIRQASPRVTPPLFTIELSASQLKDGLNSLDIQAEARGREPGVVSITFLYDPSPIQLPITETWDTPDLDVQDGIWETIVSQGQRRIRPRPGFEDYDRILNISGAFSGDRRVETEVTFRSRVEGKLYGFGVLPLWGGHADDGSVFPRRGWLYGIAWYYSKYEGAGVEFAFKQGDQPFDWVNSYQNFVPEPDATYSFVTECRKEKNANGNSGFRLRLHIRTKQDNPKTRNSWIEVSDFEGCPLPDNEYAVALVAHRCQVEFGPVTITTI